MAKTKISQFDSNPANNTDIDGINIAEGMAPGLVNNAIRELMAQLKDFQAGTAGDNFTVGGNLAVTGTSALTGNVTITGTATMTGKAEDAFPSGTKMLFQQTAAPTGWTKDTTHDNKALRIVSGTAGSGGSVNFTTAFGSQNVGATALDASQIPGHTHTFSATSGDAGSHSHTINDPSHTHGGLFNNGNIPAGGSGGNTAFSGTSAATVIGATTGISINTAGIHSHTVSGTTSSTGSGATHTHTLNLAVSYVDVIICTKS